MILPDIDFQTRESILQSFDQIAERFANRIQLKINDAIYRIVDFEFYPFSEAEHMKDPHTYKNKQQLEKGKLYLHYSGVDITCGDRKNHCGILLRSIIKLFDGADEERGFMNQQFTGPQVVATELFSNLYNLESDSKNEISLIEVERDKGINFYPSKMILKTKRVGLMPKKDDADDFYMNLQTRYIVVLPPFPKFKQVIKGIEAMLGEKVIKGEISVDEARKILGYNKSFA